LRKGKHQRLAAVEYVNLLPLRFGETVAAPYGVTRNRRAQADKHDSEEPYLPETCFNVF
jgi:hypothetical protein